MRRGIVGYQSDDLLEMRERTGGIAARQKDLADIRFRFCQVGLQTNGLLKFFERFIGVTFSGEGRSEPAMDQASVITKSERGPKLFNRFVRRSILRQNEPELEMRFRVCGKKAHGCLQMWQCFFESLLAEKKSCHVEMDYPAFGIKRESPSP